MIIHELIFICRKRLLPVITLTIMLLTCPLVGIALAAPIEYPSPNIGTIATIVPNGTLDDNGNPNDVSQTGVVTDNNGTINTNNTGSLVTTNTGTVTNNTGTVGTNQSGATVSNNSGGTITDNYGTVGNNNTGGTITNQYVDMATNAGKVGTLISGATITNNTGTVTNNQSGGEVTENNGLITANNGLVDTNNNGTITTNYGTVNNNHGIISDHRGILDTNRSGGFATIVSGQSGTVDTNYGILQVDGTLNSISASFTNTKTGVLQGIGTVNTHVNNYSIISPGNSIGTLTVGSLTLGPTSIIKIETDPVANTSDKLVVTGAAVLDGTLHHIGIDGVYQPEQSWVVLTAGTLSGQFSQVYSDLAFLTPSLSYINNQQVWLTLKRNQISFDSYADTENQHSLALALSGLTSGGLYNALLSLPDDRSVIQGAMDSLSGEAYASLPALLLEDNQRLGQQMLGRLSSLAIADNKVVELAPASGDQPQSTHGLWVAVGDNYLKNQGDNNYASARLSGPELLLGYEHNFGAGWLGGAFFRYADREFKVSDRGSEADVDSLSLGLYGSKGISAGPGVLRLSLGGNYSWHRVDMSREVSFQNFNQTNNSDYHASSAQVFGEMAYSIPLAEQLHVEPYFNVAFNHVSGDDFAEDARDSALNGEIDGSNNISSVLGGRFAYAPSELFNLRANLGWQHTFGDLDMHSLFALQAGGGDFIIAGTPLSRDAALFGLGLEVTFTPQWSLALQYDGALGTDSIAHAGMASLMFRW